MGETRRNLLIRFFGPLGRSRFEADIKAGKVGPNHPLYAVSWLPVAVPNDEDAKYYAFDFKPLRDDCIETKAFGASGGWKGTSERLMAIKKFYDENCICLVVVFAPDKPHLLMPLIKDYVSKEKLYAFMSLKMKDLPPADRITDFICQNLDSTESVVEQFCKDQSIEFLSLTKPLQEAIKSGKQAYFTYDQHWTPVGHRIVADAVIDFLTGRMLNKNG